MTPKVLQPQVRFNAGAARLLVEQNVVQSLAVAHRAYVLENGAIAFQGTPAEPLARSDLKRAYRGI
jgi:branched-chain amino acid transport system ATP-binding protein